MDDGSSLVNDGSETHPDSSPSSHCSENSGSTVPAKQKRKRKRNFKEASEQEESSSVKIYAKTNQRKKNRTTLDKKKQSASCEPSASGDKSVWVKLGVFKCKKCGFTTTEEALLNFHICNLKRSTGSFVQSGSGSPAVPSFNICHGTSPQACSNANTSDLTSATSTSSDHCTGKSGKLSLKTSHSTNFRHIAPAPPSASSSEVGLYIVTSLPAVSSSVSICPAPPISASSHRAKLIPRNPTSIMSTSSAETVPVGQFFVSVPVTALAGDSVSCGSQVVPTSSGSLLTTIPATSTQFAEKDLSCSKPENRVQKFALIAASESAEEATKNVRNGYIRYDKDSQKYACLQCSYAAPAGNGMIEHLLYQLTANPYKCLLCSEKFSTRAKIQRHFHEKHINRKVLCGLVDVKRVKQILAGSRADAESNKQTAFTLHADFKGCIKHSVKTQAPSCAVSSLPTGGGVNQPVQDCLTGYSISCGSQVVPTSSGSSVTTIPATSTQFAEKDLSCSKPENKVQTILMDLTSLDNDAPCASELAKATIKNVRKGYIRYDTDSQKYVCLQCSYATPDDSYMIEHLLYQLIANPYECLLCKFKFSTRAKIQRHFHEKHNDERVVYGSEDGKQAKEILAKSRVDAESKKQTAFTLHADFTECMKIEYGNPVKMIQVLAPSCGVSSFPQRGDANQPVHDCLTGHWQNESHAPRHTSVQQTERSCQSTLENVRHQNPSSSGSIRTSNCESLEMGDNLAVNNTEQDFSPVSHLSLVSVIPPSIATTSKAIISTSTHVQLIPSVSSHSMDQPSESQRPPPETESSIAFQPGRPVTSDGSAMAGVKTSSVTVLMKQDKHSPVHLQPPSAPVSSSAVSNFPGGSVESSWKDMFVKFRDDYVCLYCRKRTHNKEEFYIHIWTDLHPEGKLCPSCTDSANMCCSRSRSIMDSVSSNMNRDFFQQLSHGCRKSISEKLLRSEASDSLSFGVERRQECISGVGIGSTQFVSSSPPISSDALESSTIRNVDNESRDGQGKDKPSSQVSESSCVFSALSNEARDCVERQLIAGLEVDSSHVSAVQPVCEPVLHTDQETGNTGVLDTDAACGTGDKTIAPVAEEQTGTIDDHEVRCMSPKSDLYQPSAGEKNDIRYDQQGLAVTDSRLGRDSTHKDGQTGNRPLPSGTNDSGQAAAFFVCSLCSFSCDSAVDYTFHLNLEHHDESRFPCHLCNYQGLYTTDLTNHLTAHTSGDVDVFHCPCAVLQCPFKSHSFEVLSKHLEFHQECSSYVCQRCDSTFESSKDFLLHMRHNSLTLYTCSKCDARFLKRSAITGHWKRQHGDSVVFKVAKMLLCLDRKQNAYQPPKDQVTPALPVGRPGDRTDFRWEVPAERIEKSIADSETSVSENAVSFSNFANPVSPSAPLAGACPYSVTKTSFSVADTEAPHSDTGVPPSDMVVPVSSSVVPISSNELALMPNVELGFGNLTSQENPFHRQPVSANDIEESPTFDDHSLVSESMEDINATDNLKIVDVRTLAAVFPHDAVESGENLPSEHDEDLFVPPGTLSDNHPSEFAGQVHLHGQCMSQSFNTNSCNQIEPMDEDNTVVCEPFHAVNTAMSEPTTTEVMIPEEKKLSDDIEPKIEKSPSHIAPPLPGNFVENEDMVKLTEMFGCQELHHLLHGSLYIMHDDKFQCSICDRRFDTLFRIHEDLFRHMNICLFVCSFCEFKCFFQGDLKRHVKRTHAGKMLIQNSLLVRRNDVFQTLKKESPLTVQKLKKICTDLGEIDGKGMSSIVQSALIPQKSQPKMTDDAASRKAEGVKDVFAVETAGQSDVNDGSLLLKKSTPAGTALKHAPSNIKGWKRKVQKSPVSPISKTKPVVPKKTAKISSRSLLRPKSGTYVFVRSGPLRKVQCKACRQTTSSLAAMANHLKTCAHYLNKQPVSQHTHTAHSLVEKKQVELDSISSAFGKNNTEQEHNEIHRRDQPGFLSLSDKTVLSSQHCQDKAINLFDIISNVRDSTSQKRTRPTTNKVHNLSTENVDDGISANNGTKESSIEDIHPKRKKKHINSVLERNSEEDEMDVQPKCKKKRKNFVLDSSSEADEDVGQPKHKNKQVDYILEGRYEKDERKKLDKILQCKYCKFTAPSSYTNELQEHIKDEHPKQTRLIKCGHCNTLYGNAVVLKRHTQIIHPGKEERAESIPFSEHFYVCEKENCSPEEQSQTATRESLEIDENIQMPEVMQTERKICETKSVKLEKAGTKVSPVCSKVRETQVSCTSKEVDMSNALESSRKQAVSPTCVSKETCGSMSAAVANLVSEKIQSEDRSSSRLQSQSVTKQMSSSLGAEDADSSAATATDRTEAVGHVTRKVSVASSSAEADEPDNLPSVSQSEFCCVLCKQRHLSARSMRAHLIEFHYTDYKTVVCWCCNEKFGTDAEAQKHNASEHPGTRFTRKTALNPTTEKEIGILMKKSAVEREIAKVQPQSESQSNLSQLEPSPKEVDQLPGKEQFKNSVICQCCENAFNCIRDFSRHCEKKHPKYGLMHWTDLPSKGVYALSGKIVKHGSDSSSSMFKYLCGYCSWRFTTREALVNHKAESHSNRKYLWVIILDNSEPKDPADNRTGSVGNASESSGKESSASSSETIRPESVNTPLFTSSETTRPESVSTPLVTSSETTRPESVSTSLDTNQDGASSPIDEDVLKAPDMTVKNQTVEDLQERHRDPKLDTVFIVLKDILSPEGSQDLKAVLTSNGVTSFHVGRENSAKMYDRLSKYKPAS